MKKVFTFIFVVAAAVTAFPAKLFKEFEDYEAQTKGISWQFEKAVSATRKLRQIIGKGEPGNSDHQTRFYDDLSNFRVPLNKVRKKLIKLKKKASKLTTEELSAVTAFPAKLFKEFEDYEAQTKEFDWQFKKAVSATTELIQIVGDSKGPGKGLPKGPRPSDHQKKNYDDLSDFSLPLNKVLKQLIKLKEMASIITTRTCCELELCTISCPTA